MEPARTYAITSTRGCRVIDGALPVNDLVALIAAWTSHAPKSGAGMWVCDAVLSSHLNVNMVCGPQHATAAWRAALGLTAPTLPEST